MTFRIVDRRMSQGFYRQPNPPEQATIEPPRPDIVTFIETRLAYMEERVATRSELFPEAVLADVAAKRAILAEHLPEWGYAICGPIVCGSCIDSISDVAEYLPYPCPTVRALASAWNWHPDYQPEWAPEGNAGAGR